MRTPTILGPKIIVSPGLKMATKTLAVSCTWGHGLRGFPSSPVTLVKPVQLGQREGKGTLNYKPKNARTQNCGKPQRGQQFWGGGHRWGLNPLNSQATLPTPQKAKDIRLKREVLFCFIPYLLYIYKLKEKCLTDDKCSKKVSGIKPTPQIPAEKFQ